MTLNRIPYDVAKRGCDIFAASAGLVLLSPVIAITSIIVRIKLGSPVLFMQERPGRNGKIFRLYKFRSMLDVDEARGLVEDEDRLTSFGKVLRSTSLDELPSLLNVLRGDMSIVGPRPLLVEYLDRYSPAQARRHEVKPGITGLAQVRGRNDLQWEEKFALDVEYVDCRSLQLDLKIIFETARSVLVREGISQEGHVTMQKFEGSARAN
ncbi:sugar transferase [Glutamicibacter nicotianae]|uniref:sugar transferase n=1 Tax=Glutamicibacter nicotianae TaxID=37929 RepID=UPI00255473BA|nr:sugar transferase [Glutamicibacter nicotianae]WIV45665.1 sugar transferase [Glutamicibacter nicotianae]